MTTDADWEAAVLREIGQTRRFLGVPRERSSLSDDTVAKIWGAVLLVLIGIGWFVPSAWLLYGAVAAGRLLWVVFL